MGLIREVPAAMMAALRSRVFFPAAMVYLDWPGGAVRAHSGVGDMTALGATWRGVGSFGGIDVPAEGAGLIAVRSTLTLTGVPPGIFDQLYDPIRNRPGRILLGVTSKPGGSVLLSDPVSLFEGQMDALRYTMRRDGEKLVHAVQLELGSGPRARAKASIVHSYEDQIRKFPGDTAGRHLMGAEASVETMTWPG